VNHTPSSRVRRSATTLRLIAVFKLVKGFLLVAGGVEAFRLLHGDVANAIGRWAAQLHLDPDGRLVRAALSRAGALDEGKLAAAGAGMFVYAARLLTEGVGLLLEKRWAEYFTVIVTASLVPLELYEIARHVTVVRIAALAVNLAIVAYLIVRLRRAVPAS
jgi:uncharacterized membrane protein (DUF2068 family)